MYKEKQWKVVCENMNIVGYLGAGGGGGGGVNNQTGLNLVVKYRNNLIRTF